MRLWPRPRRGATGGTRLRRRTSTAALAAVVIGLLGACTSGPAEPVAGAGDPGPQSSPAPGTSTPDTSTPGPLPRPDHVMVVVFENEDATDVVGSPEAPSARSPLPGPSSAMPTARPTPASPTTWRCSPGPRTA